MDIDFLALLQYDPDQLLDRFKSSDGLDVERCIICADLLLETALISENNNYDDPAIRLKILSLNLYLAALIKDKQFKDQTYTSKVSILIEQLKDHTLPQSLLDNLRLYSQE